MKMSSGKQTGKNPPRKGEKTPPPRREEKNLGEG